MKAKKIIKCLGLGIGVLAVAGVGSHLYIKQTYPAISDAYGTAMEQSWLQALADVRNSHQDNPLNGLLVALSHKVYSQALHKLPAGAGEAAVFEYWDGYAPYLDAKPFPPYANDATRTMKLIESLVSQPMQGEVMDKVVRTQAAYNVFKHFLYKDTIEQVNDHYAFQKMWIGPYYALLGTMPLYSKIIFTMDPAALKQHPERIPAGMVTDMYTLTMACWKYVLTRAIPGRKGCHEMNLPAYKQMVETFVRDAKAGYIDHPETIIKSHFEDEDFLAAKKKIQAKSCELGEETIHPAF
ncbi:MAG: hypothetical protein GC134_05755 [Proteobacteria bacterium]|nr:hypothetical protein [Pseudomonadota bacterium]